MIGGQSIQNQVHAGMGMYQQAGQGIAAVANSAVAPTLVRAMASMDELNKRLVVLSRQASELAQTIGGPYPMPANALGEGSWDPLEADQRSFIQKLNDAVDRSHARVSDLEQTLAALQRSLGG